MVAGALIDVAEVTQTRREVVDRDHTKKVGKWPLDESGKNPVNEDSEKFSRAAVSVWDSAIANTHGHSGMREAQTRNLEIPGSMLRIAPE